jgi:hypothetical protein
MQKPRVPWWAPAVECAQTELALMSELDRGSGIPLLRVHARNHTILRALTHVHALHLHAELRTVLLRASGHR